MEARHYMSFALGRFLVNMDRGREFCEYQFFTASLELGR
jgi:hypothetical protein